MHPCHSLLTAQTQQCKARARGERGLEGEAPAWDLMREARCFMSVPELAAANLISDVCGHLLLFGARVGFLVGTHRRMLFVVPFLRI